MGGRQTHWSKNNIHAKKRHVRKLFYDCNEKRQRLKAFKMADGGRSGIN
jgi:hypothetical protein